MTKISTLGRPENPFTSRVQDVQTLLSSYVNILVCSEGILLDLMIRKKIWGGPLPPLPANYKQIGSIEYGIYLYLLNNPPLVINMQAEIVAAAFLLALLENNVGLPQSNFPSSEYDQLMDGDLFADDGSVAGTNEYELFDQCWMAALFNCVDSVTFGYLYAPSLPLPATPYRPIEITSLTQSSKIVVGLLSDWGTGQHPPGYAAPVMNGLVGQKPDCIIHLGDVYYSGTPSSDPGDADFSFLGEEAANLLQAWPDGFDNRSFALNSNHEMYSGGFGLFGDALQPSTPFAAQGNSSVFALKVGNWTILGLDSAFNSDPLGLYMYGRLDLPDTGNPQVAWVRNLRLDASKTIVLTHHTGFDFACSEQSQSYYTPFWNEVRAALGNKDPYAWYWGHVHTGIVYNPTVTINTFTTNTFCRCLGHGSLPFGPASAVQEGRNNVDWVVTNARANGQLYNGYVTLEFEIDQGNNCVAIIEKFFDSSSNNPQFTHTIFSLLGPQ